MAFKFVLTFCAVLAAANAGFVQPAATYHHAAIGTPVIAKVAQPSIDAVAATQQNVVRSFGGTVSTYSKNVVTPYSSVSKVDSRITNNVYQPAVAKTLAYAAPVPTVAAYTAAAPVVAKTVYSAPAPVLTKTVYSAPAPVLTKTLYSAPAPVYSAPVAVAKPLAYAAPAPSPLVYSHPAPAVVAAAPGLVKQAIAYSPAATVAHVTFDGFGSHWGY